MADTVQNSGELSIFELNTSPDNLALMSERDAKIVKAVTYYAIEVKAGRMDFPRALRKLMRDLRPDDAREDHPISQWVKPPLIIMTARTNRDLHWTPKSGEKQFLKAGGHIMISYNKASKKWDIWGVADEAIASYSRGIEPTNEIPQYMDLYGKFVSDGALPDMEVEYTLGEIDKNIQATSFVFGVKAAPSFVFFAESSFDLWGLESTEPYKVTPGTPVLIGILLEMWIRKIEDFNAAYIRVDQYAVKMPDLLDLLMEVYEAENGVISEQLKRKVFLMYTRLSLFSMTSEYGIYTVDKFLKLQTITTRIAAVVPPPAAPTTDES